ncbi:MAG: DUF6345 domain-containing protein [Methanoregula sp.]
MKLPKKNGAILLVLITLCVITLPVSAYQFSMTNIENFNSLPNLYPYGTNSHAYVYNWLAGQGWSQRFYETNSNVDDTDFATSGEGLNNVDLHYHFGHGDYIGTSTQVQYSNYPTSSLTTVDVYKKWGQGLISPNKWVVLDACWVLRDLQWGGALRNSHGILGFASTKNVNANLPSSFLQHCIDNDYTISYSWQRATQTVLAGNNHLVRVIFDTPDQLSNDHLPGHGTVASSEIVDDNTVYYAEWRT